MPKFASSSVNLKTMPRQVIKGNQVQSDSEIQQEEPESSETTDEKNTTSRSIVTTNSARPELDDKIELIHLVNAKIKWNEGRERHGSEMYKVSWWTDENDKRTEDTNAREYTLSKLKAGSKYYASVVRMNNNMESEPSNTISFDTAPTMPVDVQVKQYGASPHDHLLVTFKDNNLKRMAHQVVVQPLEGEAKVVPVLKATMFALVRDLTPGMEHCVSVASIDENCNGKREQSDPALYHEMVQTYPAQLDVGEPELIGNSLTLTWRKCEIRPMFYRVYCNELIDVIETTENNFTIDNVKPSTIYKFNVTAVNKVGESDKSRKVEFETAPATVSNMRVVHNAEARQTSFIVKYDYQHRSGIKYRVVAVSMSGEEAAVKETTDKYVILNGLKESQSYHIYVVTIYGGKESEKIYFVK